MRDWGPALAVCIAYGIVLGAALSGAVLIIWWAAR